MSHNLAPALDTAVWAGPGGAEIRLHFRVRGRVPPSGDIRGTLKRRFAGDDCGGGGGDARVWLQESPSGIQSLWALDTARLSCPVKPEFMASNNTSARQRPSHHSALAPFHCSLPWLGPNGLAPLSLRWCQAWFCSLRVPALGSAPGGAQAGGLGPSLLAGFWEALREGNEGNPGAD